MCHRIKPAPKDSQIHFSLFPHKLNPIHSWFPPRKEKLSVFFLSTQKGTNYFPSIQGVRTNTFNNLFPDFGFTFLFTYFTIFVAPNSIWCLPTYIFTVNVPTNKKHKLLVLVALLLWFLRLFSCVAFHTNRLPKPNRFLGIQDFAILLHNHL
jgi:hypothetical protein